jgi:spermidine synthase
LQAAKSWPILQVPVPLNSDDRPIVIFQAPYFIHSQHESAASRLLALTDACHPRTDEILRGSGTESNSEAHLRLASYWSARDEFLKAGIGIMPTDNAEELLEETREALFSSIRKSPDFEAAYYPLMAMAEKLRIRKPAVAWELLMDLEATVPERPDARELRKRLFPQSK